MELGVAGERKRKKEPFCNFPLAFFLQNESGLTDELERFTILICEVIPTHTLY